MAAPLRLFFAIWPDAAAGEATAALAREVAAARRGKPPPALNAHLTLAFLGGIAPDRVDALADIGAAAARAAVPFALTLDRLGGFRDGGIAWLGAEPVPAPLADLARALREGLSEHRFPVERRPFAAHVTLARKCRILPAREGVAPVTWHVDTLSLVASQLAAGGSRYHNLAEWRLGPTP